MELPHFSSEFNEFIKVTNGEAVTIIPDCSVVLNVPGLFFPFIGKLPVILFFVNKTFMHDSLCFRMDRWFVILAINSLERNLEMVLCFTRGEMLCQIILYGKLSLFDFLIFQNKPRNLNVTE